MPKKILISWLLVNMRPTCNNKILVYWFTIFRENEKKNKKPHHVAFVRVLAWPTMDICHNFEIKRQMPGAGLRGRLFRGVVN